MRAATMLRLCQSHPAVKPVQPTGPCAGYNYRSAKPCQGSARWMFRGAARCTKHTASVLYDLPVGRAS